MKREECIKKANEVLDFYKSLIECGLNSEFTNKQEAEDAIKEAHAIYKRTLYLCSHCESANPIVKPSDNNICAQSAKFKLTAEISKINAGVSSGAITLENSQMLEKQAYRRYYDDIRECDGKKTNTKVNSLSDIANLLSNRKISIGEAKRLERELNNVNSLKESAKENFVPTNAIPATNSIVSGNKAQFTVRGNDGRLTRYETVNGRIKSVTQL